MKDNRTFGVVAYLSKKEAETFVKLLPRAFAGTGPIDEESRSVPWKLEAVKDSMSKAWELRLLFFPGFWRNHDVCEQMAGFTKGYRYRSLKG